MKNTKGVFGTIRSITFIAIIATIVLFAIGCDNNPDEPTVTNVTVNPSSTTVAKGGNVIFTASVQGENGPAQEVMWSITTNGIHAQTTISPSGFLSVSAAETLTALSVRATSTVDTSKYGEAYVTITPAGGSDRCTVCNNDPCTCPSICTDCGNDPCTCPSLCPDCGNDPCTCQVVPPTPISGNMGNYKFGSDGTKTLYNQAVWEFRGDKVAALQAAGEIVFVIEAAAQMQLAWADSSGLQYVSDPFTGGAPWARGVYWDYETNTLTIILAGAIKNKEKFLAATAIDIILTTGYFLNINDCKILSAHINEQASYCYLCNTHRPETCKCCYVCEKSQRTCECVLTSVEITGVTIELAPGSPVLRRGRTVQFTAELHYEGTFPDGFDPYDYFELGGFGRGCTVSQLGSGGRGDTISLDGLLSIDLSDEYSGFSRVVDCSFNKTGIKGPECIYCEAWDGGGIVTHEIRGALISARFFSGVDVTNGLNISDWDWLQEKKHRWITDVYLSTWSNELFIPLYTLGVQQGFEIGPTQYVEITSAQTFNLTDLYENNVYLAYVNPTDNTVNSNNGSIVINRSTAGANNVAHNLRSGSVRSGSVAPAGNAKPSAYAQIAAFNARAALPGAGKRRQTSSLMSGSIKPLSELIVGTSTRSFYDDFSVQHTATLLATGTHSNIWVVGNEITSAKAQEAAQKFDIIYPAMVNAFGYENGGGPGGDGGMDGDTKIQILFYNGYNNNIVGYFHGKDLHAFGTVTPKSNEAEMFYMNTYYLTTEAEWEWGLGALAHEFQHLIHYTNKNLKSMNSPTWYNEMMSAMAEEIIVPFLFPGRQSRPQRLETYFDAGMRDYGMPWYVATPSSMTSWDQKYEFYFHYAEKGVFAGYLLRNYGGAKLAKAMSLNNTVGMESIQAAIAEVGTADPDFFTKFAESFFFNQADEIALGKSLNTFSHSSTETINGIPYTIAGLDITDLEYKFDSFYKNTITFLEPYSVNVYAPVTFWTITGNVSITVSPPAGGAKLFLIVR